MITGDAQALAALVREATAAGIARDALHLGLAALPPQLRQPHHDRLVEEALAPALSPSRGRLFTLPNGDLVAVAPPGGPHLVAAQAALTALFAGLDVPPPLALLHLPRAAPTLLATLEAAITPQAAATAGIAAVDGLTSSELAAVERVLASASLDAFIVRRPAWRLRSGETEPETLWTEVTLDVAGLHARLLPGVDPGAAPALAARLRGLLDRRLLAELARPDGAVRLPPAGIGLSLGCIGEPAFLRLDATLGTAGRGRMVFWFAAADLLADPVGWAYVRGFAAARGYRLGLDAPSPATLRLLPPERLGVALVRLRWRPDFPEPGTALSAGWPPEQVVLADVDRAAAIGWGWEAGITAFEGRLIAGRAAG